jgi:threonylcarbamoyladenosine tRNA methylthiotransferase MtaB
LTVPFMPQYNSIGTCMEKKCTIAIHTLGCKLNQAESEALARDLRDRGYNIADGNMADAFIINTCSVTHIAARKARHIVRKLRILNPQAMIVVTGCYAEQAGEVLSGCGAQMAIANRDKQLIPDLLAAGLPAKPQSEFRADRVNATDRVRSFIKIQDGCRNFCAYCIVPLVRDRVYCVNADAVIAEIKARVKGGCKEAVLTGTEIGSYDCGSFGLRDLISLILKETGIVRLRLSSLQPQHISQELIDLWQNNRMCRHFHIALQSGSDTVLHRMNRGYDTNLFRRAVDLIRNSLPDASVTTDIMVGFPGESDREFAESYAFCRQIEFAAMHVFSYSVRPGTMAAKMPGKINEKDKRRRSRAMLELAARSADEFAAGFTGQTTEVLWENEVRKGSGVYLGLTGNYIRTYAESRGKLSGTAVAVRLLLPVTQAARPVLRASTRGNHGELWCEVIR